MNQLPQKELSNILEDLYTDVESLIAEKNKSICISTGQLTSARNIAIDKIINIHKTNIGQ